MPTKMVIEAGTTNKGFFRRLGRRRWVTAVCPTCVVDAQADP
jgi:hypothetical protein